MIDFFSPVGLRMDLHNSSSLSEFIEIHTENHLPAWEESDLIILDISSSERYTFEIDELTINKIRNSLYNLFPGDWQIKIADMGSLHLGENTEENEKLIEEVISYLLLHEKELIILGDNQAYTYSINKAISKTEDIVNCTIIDAKIDLELENETAYKKAGRKNYISTLLRDEDIHLNNLHIIGCQSFYQAPSYFTFLNKMYVDCFKLGEIKGNIIQVEPELRDSHFTSLDVQSIENPYMPIQRFPSPNGFNAIEICKLTRLSGLGQKNKILGIFDYKVGTQGITAGEELIVQMIWYYIEGKNESFLLKNISNKEEMIIFHVPNNLIKMKFYKQPEAELWWVEINDLDIENQLFPCTYEDYQEAVKNNLSKRIKKIIEKNKV